MDWVVRRQLCVSGGRKTKEEKDEHGEGRHESGTVDGTVNWNEGYLQTGISHTELHFDFLIDNYRNQ